MGKLKPCPFCGGEGELWPKVENEHLWTVQCFGCFASIAYFYSSLEAIKAWNTGVGEEDGQKYKGNRRVYKDEKIDVTLGLLMEFLQNA